MYAARPESSTIANWPTGRGELVLIVDDEFLVRDVTQKMLNFFGYRTITAKNGSEAVSLYTKNSRNISLVITDLMMPIMDGEAAVEELRRINPAVKIIVVSGREISEHTRAKVSAFLAKPYSTREMLQLLRDLLEPALET